jgi:GNAT superfamily N-acetyltransferase
MTAHQLRIRQATTADVATVVRLWEEAAAWLKSIESDQWQYPVKMDNVRRAIDGASCWMIETRHGDQVATVTLDSYADPMLWEPADDPETAFYAHRLVVSQEARAHELGSAILDWASLKASRAGKKWLRLDVWTSNLKLRRYYLDRDFELVRIVPDIEYGVLFQRPAGVSLGRGPTIEEQPEPDTPGLLELEGA